MNVFEEKASVKGSTAKKSTNVDPSGRKTRGNSALYILQEGPPVGPESNWNPRAPGMQDSRVSKGSLNETFEVTEGDENLRFERQKPMNNQEEFEHVQHEYQRSDSFSAAFDQFAGG